MCSITASIDTAVRDQLATRLAEPLPVSSRTGCICSLCLRSQLTPRSYLMCVCVPFPSLCAGITVPDTSLTSLDAASFERLLDSSMRSWTELKRRGIWLQVPIEKADFIAPAAKHGEEANSKHAHGGGLERCNARCSPSTPLAVLCQSAVQVLSSITHSLGM